VETNRKPSGSLYKSYFRTLYLSRVALLAFWACFFYNVVWAIPWIPGGLSVSDYSWDLAVIAGSCMLIGLIATTLRSTVRQKREALVAWTAVYDEATGLHNRRYFYDCLSLECERSQRHGTPFYVLLLELRYPGPRKRGRGVRANRAALQPAAELVKNLTRSTDLVALISEGEFAVLLAGAQQDVARQLAERVRQSVNAVLPKLVAAGDPAVVPVAEVGVGTYGKDGTTPETLIEAARSVLSESVSVTSTATKAA
jgi:diguanylate cyclase (GGDEF)-like protein